MSEENKVVYDGPRTFVKSYEDVITPARCANLQIPGPSNPGGAPHVILVDHPTVDEIQSLARSGRYNLIPQDHLDRLENLTRSDYEEDQEKRQKDVMEGKEEWTQEPHDRKHKTLTRLMCFDMMAMEKGGPEEHWVWWVLLETQSLLRAKRLTEEYPFQKPRRPLAEGQYLPVKGRRSGISLLEMLEGLHDWVKETVDMMVDNGTLANSPFWFYRASSSIKPETIRLGPGDGMPLNDPQADINFPSLPNSGQAFGFNMLVVVQQMRERLSLLGDLQAGRVPQGQASALRTIGGMQTILAQGEARPERVLRRFFMMLTDIFRMYHELNLQFLPDSKEFRVSGFKNPRENPYRTIKSPKELEGEYLFDFHANVQNSSRQSKHAALAEMFTFTVNPLSIQTGVVRPEGIYNLYVDVARSLGQDPNRYFRPPSPEAFTRFIMAEDAIADIIDGQYPAGRPLEGAAMHLEKLNEFTKQDEFGVLTPDQVELFRVYQQQAQRAAQQEQQQIAAAQAAQASQQQAQSGGPAPQGANGGGNPQVQNNELLDETLPSAGGGGNVGPGGGGLGFGSSS
jgi:hypothetical protein